VTQRKPGDQNANSARLESLDASMNFEALLEASSLGTPAAARIRKATPASVVAEVRRRVEASRPPAGPRRRASRFLLVLAGIVPEAAANATDERARFVSTGAAILITSVLAVVSMWFALTIGPGVNGLAATPFAVLWGLVIMGIYRRLVVSVPVGAPRKWATAMPGLVLAILLGTLNSTPIVLRAFEPEINTPMKQHYSQLEQQISTNNKEMTRLSADLDPYDSRLAQLCSWTSRWSSGDDRARYKEAVNQLRKVLAVYNTAVEQKSHIDAVNSTWEQTPIRILTRLQALSDLAGRNETVDIAGPVLFLLFLVIACLPVTVKLLEAPDYEKVLARRKSEPRPSG
jgi:hypothetical protein